MNKRTFVIIGISAFFMLLANDGNVAGGQSGIYGNGQPNQLSVKEPFVPNRVVAKISEDLLKTPGLNSHERPGEIMRSRPFRTLADKYKSEIIHFRSSRVKDYYIVETSDRCDIEALCEKLRHEPFVKDASPDYYAVITATFPNDMYFQYQYALHNTGQVYLPEVGLSGTEGCDIGAVDGWDLTVGSVNVTIAIIDSGVATDHEDLKDKIVPGYNFVNDSDDVCDDHGHGTFVASIAAAQTNNGVGIAGVSWHSKIMAVKVMNSDGFGFYTAIGAGIRYAADRGVRVINLSIGGRNASFILEDACQYAFSLGAVIMASTGNTGSSVLYPAAYDYYCLAVAATDASDQRPAWSNYGHQVDVAAPGSFVWGARYNPGEPDNLNSYGWGSGTSYAVPYVSGAVALLIAHQPFLTNSRIMDLIKYSADDVNHATHPGVDDFIGYGRINLYTLLGSNQVEMIPTLSGWGMMILGFLLIASIFRVYCRKKGIR